MPDSDRVHIVRSFERKVCKFRVTGFHVLDLGNESEGPARNG